MKKIILLIIIALSSFGSRAQCPDFRLTIGVAGKSYTFTDKGTNVFTKIAYCPSEGSILIGAGGQPYPAVGNTYTWSNGVQGQSVYSGIATMPDNLKLVEGYNYISAYAWVCGNGTQSGCYCEQKVEVLVCKLNAVGIDENTAGGSEVMSVMYFDMQGREIVSPEAGIYVKRIFFKDGKVKSSKVLF